jgi:endonuclease-3
MKQEDITSIFAAFELSNPNPQTELYYVNNFTFLIAVILSAQMTDSGVNKVTSKLFNTMYLPEHFAAIELGELEALLKTVNYYKTKAKNIIATSNILIDKFASQIPETMEDLTSLPGVGRKTANVILNAAFGMFAMPVDTHVLRVSNRIGLSSSEDVTVVEKDLMTNIPKEYLLNAHHHLVLHGRYICKARKPDCYKCTISNWCNYYKNNILYSK